MEPDSDDSFQRPLVQPVMAIVGGRVSSFDAWSLTFCVWFPARLPGLFLIFVF